MLSKERHQTATGPDCLGANLITHESLQDMVRLGWHVDISDDTAVVSAMKDANGFNGRSYIHVFRRKGAVWDRETVIDTYKDTANVTMFPKSLSVDGDVLAVGMYDGRQGHKGAVVLVYRRGADGWSLSQSIYDLGKQPRWKSSWITRFGCAVALSDGRLFIGAESGVNASERSTGKVHVLVEEGGEFSCNQVIYPHNSEGGESRVWRGDFRHCGPPRDWSWRRDAADPRNVLPVRRGHMGQCGRA